MEFGPVALAQALGAVLAHSIPLPGGRLRKGKRLEATDLAALAQAGHQRVTVARLAADDIDEDSAALLLAQALVPDPEAAGLRLQAVGTGRVNILARGPGLARIDAARVHAVNVIDPGITLATLPPWARLEAGTMLATVKIIPYAVPGAMLARACSSGRDALSLAAPVLTHASLIQTTVGNTPPPTKGERAIATRLHRLGVALREIRTIAHDEVALTEALREATGDLLLVLTGSATSDPNDVAPQALRRAGGSVAHFGMPVDPGNLLFIGATRGRPVIGLPGCARSPALNGADWVMERVICGVPVGAQEIMRMGVGGLLKESPARPRPRSRPETAPPAD
ncbi:MAG: molybdopterin-binding protein [Pararhodobacter sp.]